MYNSWGACNCSAILSDAYVWNYCIRRWHRFNLCFHVHAYVCTEYGVHTHMPYPVCCMCTHTTEYTRSVCRSNFDEYVCHAYPYNRYLHHTCSPLVSVQIVPTPSFLPLPRGDTFRGSDINSHRCKQKSRVHISSRRNVVAAQKELILALAMVLILGNNLPSTEYGVTGTP